MSGPGNEMNDDDTRDLSRAYRDAATEEPSARLDEAMRAAARRAARSRPQPVRKTLLQRWTGPVAAAAVVVLTVSIGLMSVEEKPELAPPPMRQVLKPRSMSPVEAPAVAPASAQATDKAAPAAAEIDLSRETKQRMEQKMKDNLMVAPAQRSPQETPALSLRKNATGRAAEEPTPFVADPGGRASIKTDAPPSADAVDQGVPAAKSAPVPMQEPGLSGPLRPIPRKQPAAKAPADGDAQQPAAPRAEMRSIERAKTSTTLDHATESPEMWLARIVALRRAGKDAAADEELAEFRRAYPDYPLPEELRPAGK
jgi:negative regulator of sigma E activity